MVEEPARVVEHSEPEGVNCTTSGFMSTISTPSVGNRAG
jgi:hypothetical protein